MTDRLLVTLTIEELEQLVAGVVRKALDERGTTERLADEHELTISDVVALMRLATKSGARTIWRWRRERDFPAPHRRGNRVRWLRSEVDAWRAAQGTSGPGAVTPPEPSGRRRKTTPEERAATAAH